MSQPQLPSVTIIVLNYNGIKHLKDCFASLTGLDYPADLLELMLLDNASFDGSVEFVQKTYPRVRITRSKENLGFAAGNNQGAREATGQYIVFLNNDMGVAPQFVQGLLKGIQSAPGVVCASAKILNWDGSEFDFAGSAAHFSGHAYQVGWTKPFDPNVHNTVRPILFACGGAMMIDRQVFLDVGGFDEAYFMLYEDMDLGWRLWLMGYQIVFAPDAVVNHRQHGTMNSLPDYRKRVLYKRNALYSVIKNYSDANLSQVLPAILFARVDGVIQQAVRRGQLDLNDYDIKSARKSDQTVDALDKTNLSTLVAIQDVVEHLPEVMEKRRFVQSRRKRTDEEIAHLFQRPFFRWEDVPAATQSKVVDVFGIQSIFADVPRRVLVISSDILPFPGMPTVGSGLRAWGLAEGLKSCGHHVMLSMPRAALDKYKALVPPDVAELVWEPQTLINVVQAAEPDAVVVCNWPIMDLLPTDLVEAPLILDQHGPHYLEREYQKFGNSDDNARRKINALRKTDFFTCAGEKQLIYFQKWLLRAGWCERDCRASAAAIPVSLAPELPAHHADADLTFVYGGVFLPWQDPALGLSTLVSEMDRRGTGRLLFFGGKHPIYPVDPGMFETLLVQLHASPHVVAPGMISHDELIAAYTRAHVAIDLMRRNPERELAFTTRTVEYLWCGLPVIYNDYSELSDYIREYNAGWCVNPEDREALVKVLNDIFDHPEQIGERSRNAQRLVRERLIWNKTIDPLDRFIRHPRIRRPIPSDPMGNAHVRRWEYLAQQAMFHYRRGGLPTLVRSGVAFLQRRLR